MPNVRQSLALIYGPGISPDHYDALADEFSKIQAALCPEPIARIPVRFSVKPTFQEAR